MITLLIGYGLIVLFVVLERRGRQGEEAKSMDRGASDRRSTLLLGAGYGVCFVIVLLAPVLNLLHVAPTGSDPAGWAGVAIAASGIALRLWANRVLGQFYTRTLRVADSQPIIQNGPYRLIRHPGYLGTILVWVGVGLSAQNWIALAIITPVVVVTYSYRIRVEEEMLMAARGDPYREYVRRTKRLIPFVY